MYRRPSLHTIYNHSGFASPRAMYGPDDVSGPQYHFQTTDGGGPHEAASSSSRPSFNAKPTHYAPYGFSGDGWSQLLLPIPADVDDPYEFLARIQNEWDRQSAALAAKRRRGGGGRNASERVEAITSALSSSSTATAALRTVCEADVGKWQCFLRLPTEVWDAIAVEVCRTGDGFALACASRAFNDLVAPMMYATPTLRSLPALTSFLDTMSAHANGTALSCISPSAMTSLSLQLTSIDWDKAERLAKTLAQCGTRIRTLKVECAGSDLERARVVFAHFDPEVFEWHTAPCWLIRPAEIFEQILLAWPRLHTLKLSGFFWDSNFVSTLVNLPSLRTLHLSGRTMSSLSWECLYQLLDPSAEGGLHCLQLSEIHLSDLPPGKASTFDDENEALCRAGPAASRAASYFAATRPARAGSLSPTLAIPASIAAAAAAHVAVPPPLHMIRAPSVDSGTDLFREAETQTWQWQCENRDYGKQEGRGAMRWWRSPGVGMQNSWDL